VRTQYFEATTKKSIQIYCGKKTKSEQRSQQKQGQVKQVDQQADQQKSAQNHH